MRCVTSFSCSVICISLPWALKDVLSPRQCCDDLRRTVQATSHWMCLASTKTTIATGQYYPAGSLMSVSRDSIRDIISYALGGKNRPVTYRGTRCVAANSVSRQSQWSPQNEHHWSISTYELPLSFKAKPV
ncbi:uncharacterized protein B0T23DRAFT_67609 [Neurospora hispaniola]|uniref:Secreted protein n=1 Tax=Neurospora hispaniola TaxID=588809 RepID=A0AAJ0IBW7_9PEZI|nr:hypothetical protein B0T23DRAFT_67609 [Neurospora hispaniola]